MDKSTSFPNHHRADFCLDLWVVLCIFFAFAFAFAKKELPYVWAAVEKGNIIIIYSNIKYNNNNIYPLTPHPLTLFFAFTENANANF